MNDAWRRACGATIAARDAARAQVFPGVDIDAAHFRIHAHMLHHPFDDPIVYISQEARLGDETTG
jgi:hypothetical protein